MQMSRSRWRSSRCSSISNLWSGRSSCHRQLLTSLYNAVRSGDLGGLTRLPEDGRGELVAVNGQPALVMRAGERAFSVLTIEVAADRIQIIRFMANPQKLRHV